MILLTFVCVVLWFVGGDGGVIVHGAVFDLGKSPWWKFVVAK